MSVRLKRVGKQPSSRILSGDESMGEVRVKVKLTNAVDEELLRRGQIAASDVHEIEAEAVVDTGSVRCVLPPDIVDQLGLSRVGKFVAEYADGHCEEVDLTDGVRFEMLGRRTLEEAIVLGDEILIGQTALEKLDLFVDCLGQRLVPNPAHPDQPVARV